MQNGEEDRQKRMKEGRVVQASKGQDHSGIV